MITSAVIGTGPPRNWHVELLAFLKIIDRQIPRGLHIHQILDNYATHQHIDAQK